MTAGRMPTMRLPRNQCEAGPILRATWHVYIESGKAHIDPFFGKLYEMMLFINFNWWFWSIYSSYYELIKPGTWDIRWSAMQIGAHQTSLTPRLTRSGRISSFTVTSLERWGLRHINPTSSQTLSNQPMASTGHEPVCLGRLYDSVVGTCKVAQLRLCAGTGIPQRYGGASDADQKLRGSSAAAKNVKSAATTTIRPTQMTFSIFFRGCWDVVTESSRETS